MLSEIEENVIKESTTTGEEKKEGGGGATTQQDGGGFEMISGGSEDVGEKEAREKLVYDKYI